MRCPALSAWRARLFIPALCLALASQCAVPAWSWESAIPPGLSDIEVPDVPDPVCAHCHGAGCSICQPDLDDDGPYLPLPDPVTPDPEPDSGATGTDQNQPATDPQPPVSPGPVAPPQVDPFVQSREALAAMFRTPSALLSADNPAAEAPLPVVPPDEEGLFGAGSLPQKITDSGSLTAEQWSRARACQREIDAIYSNWPLSAADIARLDILEPERNRLWALAVAIPGLTAEERERMRLSLHVVPASTQLPSLSSQQISAWLPPAPLPSPSAGPPRINPVVKTLLNEFAVEKPAELIETMGEDFAEQNLGKYGGMFGSLLSIGKIGVAYQQSGTASVVAAAADWLVGCIPLPQAQLAVGGGRVYADVAHQAQTKFMEDAMSITGDQFDSRAFWDDLKKDNGVGVAALMEWTGYGD